MDPVFDTDGLLFLLKDYLKMCIEINKGILTPYTYTEKTPCSKVKKKQNYLIPDIPTYDLRFLPIRAGSLRVIVWRVI